MRHSQTMKPITTYHLQRCPFCRAKAGAPPWGLIECRYDDSIVLDARLAFALADKTFEDDFDYEGMVQP